MREAEQTRAVYGAAWAQTWRPRRERAAPEPCQSWAAAGRPPGWLSVHTVKQHRGCHPEPLHPQAFPSWWCPPSHASGPRGQGPDGGCSPQEQGPHPEEWSTWAGVPAHQHPPRVPSAGRSHVGACGGRGGMWFSPARPLCTVRPAPQDIASWRRSQQSCGPGQPWCVVSCARAPLEQINLTVDFPREPHGRLRCAGQDLSLSAPLSGTGPSRAAPSAGGTGEEPVCPEPMRSPWLGGARTLMPWGL